MLSKNNKDRLQNFKAIMKKTFVTLLTIGSSAVLALSLAACNKDKSTSVQNKNPGGEQQKPPEVQVETTVKDILAQYHVVEPSVTDIAKTYLKENEELISAKLNDFGDLEMIFKDRNLIFSRVADFSSDMQLLLSGGWEAYVLSKLNVTSLDEVISGRDDVDSFTQKIEAAINSYNAEIKELSNARATRNDFGGGNYDDKGALKKIVKDNLLEYKYNSVREDESFVVIGVDKQGNVIEYLVQMNELAGGDVYKRFVNGIEEVDYTLTRTVLDISERYAQPAEREVVSFDDIYTSVFGKDFVFKPYKEIISEITNSFANIEPIVTGFVDGKFRIYGNSVDRFGISKLAVIDYRGSDEQIINDLDEYAKLCELIGDDFKNYFKLYENNYLKETESYSTAINYMKEMKNKIDKLNLSISKLDSNSFSGKNIITNSKDNLDFNAFGEQYLKEVGKTDAKLIASFVGAITPHRIDTYQDNFDSGYVSTFDMAIMYAENTQVKVYKTTVVVPWYTNSTNESLYNSFFSADKHLLVKEETATVENANLLIDLPNNNNEKEINLNDLKQDIFIEEDKRLA